MHCQGVTIHSHHISSYPNRENRVGKWAVWVQSLPHHHTDIYTHTHTRTHYYTVHARILLISAYSLICAGQLGASKARYLAHLVYKAYIAACTLTRTRWLNVQPYHILLRFKKAPERLVLLMKSCVWQLDSFPCGILNKVYQKCTCSQIEAYPLKRISLLSAGFLCVEIWHMHLIMSEYSIL